MRVYSLGPAELLPSAVHGETLGVPQAKSAGSDFLPIEGLGKGGRLLTCSGAERLGTVM